MHVLFDAHWWAEGPVSNRQVQREFIRHWVEEFPQDEVTLAVRRRHLTAVRSTVPHGVRLMTTRLWPHGLAAILEHPVLARRTGADVTINHNFAPAFGRSAVFVHDVLFQTNPEWFTRKERVYLALIPLMLPRAEVVLSSTQTEGARIAAHNPRARDVVPIGLAVGTDLAGAVPRRPSYVPEDLEYVLSVGRINVRKNLAFTFEAALRSGAVTPERPLIVVGEREGVGIAVSPEVAGAIESSAIRFAGRVDDAELAWLYRNARLFTFLSLDEGFGLPPLEALTFGAPALVSDIPVFRENLGSAATFVNPQDVEAAAAAMADLLALPRTHPAGVNLPTWRACVRRMREAIANRAPSLGDKPPVPGSRP